jgi:hydroxymethylpyrimidine/phosphomethylpyrimidine kinase
MLISCCSGYFVEYLLNRPDVADVWKTFVHHPFVMAMGNGSLPVESFKGYMVQDYLFLIHFARANSLAGAKTNDVYKILKSTEAVNSIMQETKLHIKYCESLGIPLSELQSAQELQACTAYTRYVLDVGQTEDWLALQVALAPCMLGYGAVAQMLHGHGATKRDGNRYWSWIEAYISDEYLVGVKQLNDLLEKYVQEQSPSRIEELVRIFIHATRMEIGFWEMFPHQ